MAHSAGSHIMVNYLKVFKSLESASYSWEVAGSIPAASIFHRETLILLDEFKLIKKIFLPRIDFMLLQSLMSS